MPDDRERIIQRLQSALRNEHLSVGCYDIHAQTADELRQPETASVLRRMGRTHAAHVEELEARIRELGGEPTVYRLTDILKQNHGCATEHDLLAALEQDLKAEDTQIEEYEILARQSDGATAEMCARHIEEDRAHLQWLREQVIRLHQWDASEESLGEEQGAEDQAR